MKALPAGFLSTHIKSLNHPWPYRSLYLQNILTSSLPLRHHCNSFIIPHPNYTFLHGFSFPYDFSFWSTFPNFFLDGIHTLKFKYVIISLQKHFPCFLRTVDKPRFVKWLTWSFISFPYPSPQLSNQAV